MTDSAAQPGDATAELPAELSSALTQMAGLVLSRETVDTASDSRWPRWNSAAAAFDIDGYLQGLLPLETSQEHVLAVALNERLEEVHRAALVPLPTAPPAEADGDARRAVIEELLGREWSRPRPSDGTD
jgi:hypothetical protein